MPNSIPDLPINTSSRPPLAGWMGGKSLLAKRIIERIPEHACYVEPFAGAAWVLFKKPESKVEVINDINKEVVTLYRCLQWHLEEFIRYFKWVLVSREEFERLKKSDPDTLTDIQRSARFYYLQQACFGGRITSPTFGYGITRASKLNLLRIEEYLSAAHLRLARVYVECLPYAEVISRYDGPDTFFYVDPPYWDCEDRYGQGIFSRDDFAKLAAQLAGIKGKFLLSLNDTPGVRETFGAFAIEAVQTQYTCSNGKNMPAGEVLIRNY
ncbi:D12 class N6 adenine-specific DNA methyltransferase [uncultured delta proteobacterium]|uniref:site-specific DNA-methyltransferase (adenine-specific) n=1 Tax=uncultured delta proteobacterium TaxID=34034 RepID=A0A212J7Q5_9DELT|nr:D12 class N6 adenine-specific DNA methyltransferase [uncultured delta proteobacterium]